MALPNLILDLTLIMASIWMVFAVRGVGGIVGRSFNLITIGLVILGIAHLFTTLTGQYVAWSGTTNSMIHRLVVLIGFIVVAVGFQQASRLKV